MKPKGPCKRPQQHTTLLGPTMLSLVARCWPMCTNGRNKSQHVGSLDENTKDSGTFSISDAMLISCSHVFGRIRGM